MVFPLNKKELGRSRTKFLGQLLIESMKTHSHNTNYLSLRFMSHLFMYKCLC
jgi:hypothetical protein